MVPSDLLEHCRLCLVKECVSVNIFENEAEIRQLYYKIVATLPVQISRQDDKLPKKICKNCNLKVDELYQFWSITANSQKTLLQWLHEAEQTTALTKIKCEFDADVPGGATAAGGGSIRMKVEPEEHSSDDERGDGVGDFDDYRDDSDTMMDSENLVPENMVNVSLKDGDGETGAQHQERKPKKLPGLNSKKKKNSSSRELKTKSKKPSGIAKNVDLRPCTLCEKKLASERKLKEHIRKQHPTSVEAELIRRERYEKEKVQCPYCAKFLSRKEKLTRHIRTVHTDVNYKCEICGEEFLSKTRYNRHVVTHEEKQKFECECGYVTCNKYRLTEHVRRTHLKDYKVLCPFCGYGCFRNAELEEHFISAHSADRFKCVFCEKSFARNCNLKLHIRRYHDKSENTECPLCGKSFPSRGRLNEHLIQVHPAQKHQCHICNKVVVSEKTLKKHLLLHTNSEPFHCPECGKAFKFKRYVTLHMRTHTGNWPTFVCKICNATISSEYRTKHMQSHDIEKTFLCSICAAGFINDSGLKAHMRKHQQ